MSNGLIWALLGMDPMPRSRYKQAGNQWYQCSQYRTSPFRQWKEEVKAQALTPPGLIGRIIYAEVADESGYNSQGLQSGNVKTQHVNTRSHPPSRLTAGTGHLHLYRCQLADSNEAFVYKNCATSAFHRSQCTCRGVAAHCFK